MRILLAATRRIHSAAVTLHIAALRAGVWASGRKVAATMKLTDAAVFARGVAEAALEEARDGVREARNIETRTRRADHAYHRAAQAEADMLRRGVSL